MENHKELSLSSLRRYIIRYGAKAMDSFESDLFYDCKGMENLSVGESIFWMVSEAHTYLYTAKSIVESNLNVDTVRGDRFNYRIDCYSNKYGEQKYSMTRVWKEQIAEAVNKYIDEVTGGINDENQ